MCGASEADPRAFHPGGAGNRPRMATTTTDHDEIRRWVEERGGRPSHVADTASNGDEGILRIDFGEPDEGLEEISWDDWFAAFDENELAFLYEPDGESRFNKLVSRNGG
jgi:hypothetical protein